MSCVLKVESVDFLHLFVQRTRNAEERVERDAIITRIIKPRIKPVHEKP